MATDDEPGGCNGIYAAPICIDCARLRDADIDRPGFRCDAFPDGIPDEILRSRVFHLRAYPGDHGLAFVPKSKDAAASAEQRIAWYKEWREWRPT